LRISQRINTARHCNVTAAPQVVLFAGIQYYLDMSKYLTIALILAAVVIGVSLFFVNLNNMVDQAELGESGQDVVTDIDTGSETENGQDITDEPASTGTVAGRLCFPSEFIPDGWIYAKNTATQEEFTQFYPGSVMGGGTTYTFDLPEGTYYLRYGAKPYLDEDTVLYGYHTEQCPTGGEETCAQGNVRTNVEITVTAGGTISGVDLCDFYYAESNEPAF
jgi:hypothetical protein